MTIQSQNVDFRDYRPAAVILFDFVKHSKRRPEEVHVIQCITEDILADTKHSLQITDSVFNHTGDGWICMLLGDDSARVMDFVNLCFMSLWQRLEPYKQKLRTGIDYGMIHLRHPPIGTNQVTFETPGINAARLEAVSQHNKILCTEAVFSLFSPHYDDMFSKSSKQIETKDRILKAYEIIPRPLPNIRAIISDILFDNNNKLINNLRGTKKIMVVDDDINTLRLISVVLENCIEKERIVIAKEGDEALSLFMPNEFIAVITDIFMPRMDGYELTRRISLIDPNVPILIISGYCKGPSDEKFLESGAVIIQTKPINPLSILRALSFTLAFGTPLNIQNRLRLITDKPIEFLHRILTIADDLSIVFNRANDKLDVGHSMLRHKAKQIANEICKRLVPGSDILHNMESAGMQIRKIERLCSVVQPYEKLHLELLLRNMISDYGKAYRKVEIQFECSLQNCPDLTGLQSIVLLITCEFIDNAIDAIEQKGIINVVVLWERTPQQLRIQVSDNGLGVQSEMVHDLFISNQTTKGEGRGIGLSLVKQACDAFRGSVQYLRDDITSFTATLRVPIENKE